MKNYIRTIQRPAKPMDWGTFCIQTYGSLAYHTPEDTADKLNYENIKRVAQLVFLTAWEIANQL